MQGKRAFAQRMVRCCLAAGCLLSFPARQTLAAEDEGETQAGDDGSAALVEEPASSMHSEASPAEDGGPGSVEGRGQEGGTNFSAALLVRFPTESELTRQLTVELAAMGFQVERTRQLEGPAPVQIRWVSGSEVELTLVDGSRLSMVRPPELSKRLFAVRVAEQARASLLLSGVEEAEPEPANDSQVAPAVPTTPPPLNDANAWLHLEVGAAVEWGGDAFGGSVQLVPTVQAFVLGSLGVEAWSNLGLHASQVRASEGTAELRLSSLGGGLVARENVGQRVSLQAALGAGGALGTMRGESTLGRAGVTDRVSPALAYAAGAVSYFPAKNLFLRARFRGLRYLPELTMKFGDRTVAKRTWTASLGLSAGATF